MSNDQQDQIEETSAIDSAANIDVEENRSQEQIDGEQSGLTEGQASEQAAPSDELQSAIDAQRQAEPANVTVESVIEAVLFASDEPLTADRLAKIVEITPKQVRTHVEALNEKYKAGNSAFQIEQIAGGYQMLTLSHYSPWLKKLIRAREDDKLSPAALETLAIIAYKQPIIRADVEAIRGVAAGEMIRGLMFKGLVKIAGRADILGRPLMYGTTKKFLEIFGLNSLKDLPKIEELKKPADDKPADEEPIKETSEEPAAETFEPENDVIDESETPKPTPDF